VAYLLLVLKGIEIPLPDQVHELDFVHILLIFHLVLLLDILEFPKFGLHENNLALGVVELVVDHIGLL
jgi:hypothetical protein